MLLKQQVTQCVTSIVMYIVFDLYIVDYTEIYGFRSLGKLS